MATKMLIEDVLTLMKRCCLLIRDPISRLLCCCLHVTIVIATIAGLRSNCSCCYCCGVMVELEGKDVMVTKMLIEADVSASLTLIKDCGDKQTNTR